MLNIVAHKLNKIGAVLIRAIEPTEGIEIMRTNRPAWEMSDLTNGPGKLTVALRIDKSLNDSPVFSSESEIIIANSKVEPEIGCSNRIGVRKDLKRKLRFFIKASKFVSGQRY